MSAEISPSLGSAQAVVTEDVANPLVGFDVGSLEASVNDSELNASLLIQLEV